ncbi:DNA-protecting protein DprA [Superficieibacter electus]|uniref:DNA-protecting protein DprA n=1 Tax=Superficieibacter electus TaxID=2022662 RepID=A0A2P5GHM4_9ENTR|nr:DNA-protecting protein DprA [Superficieibacter electus]POP40744.1 DNA-protecting protein DprA [Superficieibacter electus]POP41989.1 DNA-protecting protein DprA [Superficieibacter electus]
MTPTEIWLRLINVRQLYGDRMIRLARNLIKQSHIERDTLLAAGLTVKQSAAFMGLTPAELDRSLAWLAHSSHHLIVADDARYPPQLRAINDYPGALFVDGDPACLTSPQLAIVGSRNHSWYGQQWGERFSQELASCGLIVTSGLARGIDGVAHTAALGAKGKSIAVLGNGLFLVHPRSHNSLASAIVQSGGAVLSEFPLSAPPRPENFPQRNRIISGLSLGVLVIEAAIRSGSLVTARCALEQGREVFALPGPLGNPGSEGPHWLIKQGAIPVTALEDILENVQFDPYSLPDKAEITIYSPEHEVAALPFPELLANVGDEVTPVDVVAERAGQPVPVTVAQLLELELAGWIAAVPGGYVRLRRASHVRRTNVFV